MTGWKNFSDRVTGDHCMNLSRALLSGLTNASLPTGSDVYKKYLRDAGMTGVGGDHVILTAGYLTDAFDVFWGGRFDASTKGKRINPKYFDISNLDDVNRLASAMGCNIGLYITSPPSPTPELLHDTFILASCYGDRETVSRPRVFFVVSYEQSAYHLYKMRQPFHSMDTDPVHLLSEWVSVSRECFVKSVLELLGFWRRHESLAGHRCSPNQEGLLFESDGDHALLTQAVDRDIVFLAWPGLKKMYIKRHQRQRPSNQRFVKLAVLKKADFVDWKNAVYIVVDVVKRVMGKLKESYAAAYIAEEPVVIRQSENSKKRLSEALAAENKHDSFSSVFAGPGPDGKAGAWGFDKIKTQLISDDEDDDVFGVGSVDELAAKDDTCRCDTCVSSGRTFGKNMSGPTGQQRVYKTYNSADELLQILCWNDRDTVERLDMMARLSIAAMDIESGTGPLADAAFGSFEETTVPKNVQIYLQGDLVQNQFGKAMTPEWLGQQ